MHAIGKGLLVAEIQQASDVTYRLHDFDRTDAAGNKRELHTAQALDYEACPTARSSYRRKVNEPVRLVERDYFTTNLLEADKAIRRDYCFDSFVIQICVRGSYWLEYGEGAIPMRLGDCVLIPAAIQTVRLESADGFALLASYIT